MPPRLVYEPLDAATLADPYPVFAHLREHAPVVWHAGMQSWLLLRYADCVVVLRDHERFARDRRRAGASVPEPSLSVQSLDPPDQAAVRSLFMNALHAQDLAAVEARAQSLVTHLFAALAGRPSFDVMTEVAAPLAVAVISDLLGVTPPDVASFAQVSDAIMRSMDGGLDPAVIEPGRVARERLTALVESWFQTSNRPGLLASVRASAPAGLEGYVRNTARVMFQGGYSTMVAAIGNTVHTLLSHVGLLEVMRDPTLLRTGLEELLRYDGPVQGTSRIALETTILGGVTVSAGDTVTVLFSAANHDPAQFAEPERVVLDRTPNRHLAFGWGTHACLGTVAAQTALRALVRGLLARPEPLVATTAAQRRRTATMRTFGTLPATFRS